MSADRIHISRGDLTLGVWTLVEVRELLNDGFLLPTDDYWVAGQPDWRPLSELPPDKPSAASAVMGRFGQALRDAAQTVECKPRQVIGAASNTAERQKHQVAQATERLLKDYLPKLREPVSRALAATSQTVETVLRDEVLLRKIFGAAYDVLPRSVCRFIDERTFVEFCLKHRARLLSDPTAHEEAESP